MGSTPGQYFAAIVSLMTTTVGARSSSRSVNPLPRTILIPSVVK
jgi:hypothetical protein